MVKILTDLRGRFQAARDQGRRPSCLAFAMSDAHAADRKPHAPLSVDYLFYHAANRSAHRDFRRGMGIAEGQAALQHDGQPAETGWPYTTALPANITGWKPPAGLPVFRGTTRLTRGDFGAAIDALNAGQPAVLVFRPSERFYYANTAGFLSTRSPDPELSQRHAVVAVAHGDVGGVRHVLVRNSWGLSWGQAGHAWLGEDYLSPRVDHVFSIQAS